MGVKAYGLVRVDFNNNILYLVCSNNVRKDRKMHDIFYFTDIHGTYDLYRAIINYCLNEDPECTIIFGGDACDRGKDGYKIIKELLNNPQVIYLKGNHEDLFVRAARELNQRFKFTDKNRDYLYTRINSLLAFNSKYPDIQLHLYNGGLETLVDWICDDMPMDIIDAIDKLPLTFSYEQYDFCHAGGQYKTFKEVADAEYNHKQANEKSKENLLWDRTVDIGWAPNRICVHGHTPTIHIRSKYYGKDKSIRNIHPCAWIGDFFPDKYTGWRLDMDTSAAQSGIIFVFNVLTNEIIQFKRNQQDIEIFNKGKIIFNK